jgi:hypothetical protein
VETSSLPYHPVETSSPLTGRGIVAWQVVTALQGESGPATLKTLYGDEARRFDNRCAPLPHDST